MAYGAPFSPDLPVVSAGAGMKTPFGITLLPPGSRVAAYVRSTGAQAADDPFTVANLVPTLAAGLARARSGLGDTVVVMPGHTESVTDATMLDNLVPGTRIVGFGRGSNMPVFRWTATGSQWVLNDADVTIQGLRLRLEGANGVVKAINVTAADCAILGCDIQVGSGASNKAAIAIEIGTGADRFELVGNNIRGSVAGSVVNCVLVAGVSDGVRICDNEILVATTVVGVGPINVTAAATQLKVMRNVIANMLANSETCMSVGAVAATGVVCDNYGSTEAGTPVSDIFEFNAASLLRCFQNFGTDTKNTSGLLSPAVVT